MSDDGVASHEAWVEKLGLPFRLVADTERVALGAYGVYGEREYAGRTYMGIARTTFLVDAGGRIARVWERVKPDGHAAAVLEALRELDLAAR